MGDAELILTLDPYPDLDTAFYYGYYARGADLYSTTETDVDVPDEFVFVLIDAVMLDYYLNIGVGAPQNSAAGRDARAMIELIGRKQQSGMMEMHNHVQKAGAMSRVMPATQDRAFYRDAFGRDV